MGKANRKKSRDTRAEKLEWFKAGRCIHCGGKKIGPWPGQGVNPRIDPAPGVVWCGRCSFAAKAKAGTARVQPYVLNEDDWE